MLIIKQRHCRVGLSPQYLCLNSISSICCGLVVQVHNKSNQWGWSITVTSAVGRRNTLWVCNFACHRVMAERVLWSETVVYKILHPDPASMWSADGMPSSVRHRTVLFVYRGAEQLFIHSVYVTSRQTLQLFRRNRTAERSAFCTVLS